MESHSEQVDVRGSQIRLSRIRGGEMTWAITVAAKDEDLDDMLWKVNHLHVELTERYAADNEAFLP